MTLNVCGELEKEAALAGKRPTADPAVVASVAAAMAAQEGEAGSRPLATKAREDFCQLRKHSSNPWYFFVEGSWQCF